MTKVRKKLGPYSKTLRRGAVGTSVDGRSPQGRFLRDAEAQLIEHIGGKPSIAEKLLIGRLAIVLLRLNMLDEKALSDTGLNGFDVQTHAALHRALVNGLRELGMQPAAAKPLTMPEFLAQRAAAAKDSAA